MSLRRENYEAFKAQEAARIADRRRTRIEAGLCSFCGKRPPVAKHHCEECRIDNLKRVVARNAKNREAGLCVCGKRRPVANWYCEPCRVRHNLRARARLQKKLSD